MGLNSVDDPIPEISIFYVSYFRCVQLSWEQTTERIVETKFPFTIHRIIHRRFILFYFLFSCRERETKEGQLLVKVLSFTFYAKEFFLPSGFSKGYIRQKRQILQYPIT